MIEKIGKMTLGVMTLLFLYMAFVIAVWFLLFYVIAPIVGGILGLCLDCPAVGGDRMDYNAY